MIRESHLDDTIKEWWKIRIYHREESESEAESESESETEEESLDVITKMKMEHPVTLPSG